MAGDVVMLIFFTALAGVAARQTVLLWRGNSPYYNRDAPPPGLPVPPSMWKHYIRASPALMMGGVFLAMAGWIAVVANGVLTIVFALLSLVCCFALFPILLLFAWPKALIPPSCRQDEGWLSARQHP